jgi:NAD(P)-dependent dehydrogenase (short-subunit alcohol dehydrogenase family)
LPSEIEITLGLVNDDLLVVVGVGGMGEAIARQVGEDRPVLLADFDGEALESTAAALRNDGRDVTTRQVDVADAGSVTALVEAASSLGPVAALAHTAGLSPVQAPSERIVDVDLIGVANALESFAEVIAPGGAGVIISSNSGFLVGPLPAEDAASLAGVPAGDLNGVPCVQAMRDMDPGLAYAYAKRAVRFLVQQASQPWGRHRARINSLSPGIISTPMGDEELAGPHGEGMRAMVAASAAGREGKPEEIAAATAFLLSPAASFITGTDLLVDGGMVAALLAPPTS